MVDASVFGTLMPSIVLATLNARYAHSSFGLRYLLANMGSLQEQTALLEFTINDQRADVLAAILAHQPRIVGFGVYIWNVEPLTQLVADLKQLCPEMIVVLGGPEVSYETSDQKIVSLADFVITGEADIAFRELCLDLLGASRPNSENIDAHTAGVKSDLSQTVGSEAVLPFVSDSSSASEARIIHAAVPQTAQLQLPYDLYSDDDIAHRVIYVEASRGCPYSCEFCLSALEIPVRQFDLNLFLNAMTGMLERGARQFKFVDRTFNLNLKVSHAILQFFLERIQPGLFLHFEMIPDRLPESLRELIARFPPGSLQFEIGVQTFNDVTGQLISRKQDHTALEQNFRFLREQTGVHIHADLIAGLPGEDLQSFAAGFNRLRSLRPQEIQIGILKRLRGTPIIRHDAEWQMVYSQYPPYEILSNRLLSFDEIQQLRRFARYWDLIGNSGHFSETLDLLLQDGDSAFERFSELCTWLKAHQPSAHGIALTRLFQLLFDFLAGQKRHSEQLIAETLWRDYGRAGRRDRPEFVRRFMLPQSSQPQNPPEQKQPASSSGTASEIPARQSRHQSRP